MKTVRFGLCGSVPRPGHVGHVYTAFEPANRSGEYVPLAEAERLASRVAALEHALRGMVLHGTSGDPCFSDECLYGGDHCLECEAARAALEPTERTMP